MPTYSFTLTEHDPERPWIVVARQQHHTVELEEGVAFFAWARDQWPPPRWSIQLDRCQLSPTARGARS